jgi:hypothetical protein
MTKFEVLYYPEFEPPEVWLRSYLLFYDKINTIIPDEVKNPFSFNISQFLDVIPDTLEGISPRDKEISIRGNNLELLNRAFKSINEQQKDNKKFPDIFLYNNGKIGFGGDFITIHDKKFSLAITSMLEDNHLFFEKQDQMIKHYEQNGIRIPDMKDYKIVNKDAGNLVLSMIADNIGRNYGLNTITYNNFDFVVNELNSIEFQRKNIGKSSLISSMIRCEVPQDITKLSLEQYKEVRENYSDIKLEFHSIINELTSLYCIDEIEDNEILDKKVREISKDFNEQFEQFKKKQTMRKIRKWVPFFIKSFAKTAATIFTNDWSLNVSSHMVGIASEVIPNIFPQSEVPHENYLRLLANMQKEVFDKSELQKIYFPPQYLP